jgi:hypothetical protein
MNLKEPVDKNNITNAVNPAIAAITYALRWDCAEPIEFLRCWMHGEVDAIRKEWPEAPDSVFIGLEPLPTAQIITDH